jgi:hypothetical protein
VVFVVHLPDILSSGEVKLVQRVIENYQISKYKSKAIPVQAWTGLDCSRRLRLPDLKRIGTALSTGRGK